jgi:multiple sugar transport system substrate-binding protein
MQVLRTRGARLGGLAAVAALAACGGVGGGSAGPAPSGGGDGASGPTVETMGFGLPDAIATERIAAAEEQGLTVEVVEGGFDQQQFLSAVAAGDPPDAVYLARTDIGTYAARGALQPMDDCVESAGVVLEDFREPALAQVRVDDVVYGLPEFYSVRVVLADEQVMAEAGVTPEQVSGADWDALAEASAAMSEADGGSVGRIGFDPKLPEFLPMWAKANGVDLVDESGDVHLDDPAVVEVVQMAKDIVDEAGGWSAFQSFRDSWDFFGEANQFASDQLGAMPMEDWYVNVLADVSPEAGVVVQPFLDRDGEPLTYATGSAWAIPEGVRDYDASCTFAATMTAKDTWIRAARARAEEVRAEDGLYTGTYTGNQAADEVIFSEVFQPTGNDSLDEAVDTILSVQDAAFSLPPTPAGAQITDAYEQAVTRVLLGEQDAQAAMGQAQAEAEAALAEAGEGTDG